MREGSHCVRDLDHSVDDCCDIPIRLIDLSGLGLSADA